MIFREDFLRQSEKIELQRRILRQQIEEQQSQENSLQKEFHTHSKEVQELEAQQDMVLSYIDQHENRSVYIVHLEIFANIFNLILGVI